jgi:hypothetical protein
MIRLSFFQKHGLYIGLATKGAKKLRETLGCEANFETHPAPTDHDLAIDSWFTQHLFIV